MLQVVAAVRLLALNLAATGELEALLSTRVGLLLRHSCRSPYIHPPPQQRGSLVGLSDTRISPRTKGEAPPTRCLEPAPGEPATPTQRWRRVPILK